MDYSQFLDEVKHGSDRQGGDRRAACSRRRPATGARSTTYAPPDLWMVSDLLKNGVKIEAKPEEEQSFLMNIFVSLVPDAVADRRLDILHAPDAGRRPRRRVLVRQEQGAHAGRIDQQHDLRRCGRLRRGQGRSLRTGRFPARSDQVPETRRAHSARRADGRQPRYRQDAAGQGHRRRSQGAVLLDLRFRFRRNVRRRRRGARARHVRAGQEACAVHRLHRRNRRGRPPARRWPGRRQRRTRTDPEPVAGRDGRLRGQRRRHRDRRDQPSRRARPGAAAPGPFRPPGRGAACRISAAASRS